MNTKSANLIKLNIFAWAMISLLAVTAARAQSLYSNEVMSLNPVAYWPLQENVQPPSYDVETNLGLFGPIANVYYSCANVYHSQPGIDGSTSVRFVGANNSFAIVPTTDHRVSLQPGQPFTVECWI